MPLLNRTTEVDADKSIAEIQKLLGSHGASQIMTDYNDGVISAISFVIPFNNTRMGFRLPCDWRPVYDVMRKEKNWDKYQEGGEKLMKLESDLRLQSVRTAWRILLVWCRAQMALIDTAMVKTQEVFLPYAIMKDGRTLAQHAIDDPSRLLGN